MPDNLFQIPDLTSSFAEALNKIVEAQTNMLSDTVNNEFEAIKAAFNRLSEFYLDTDFLNKWSSDNIYKSFVSFQERLTSAFQELGDLHFPVSENNDELRIETEKAEETIEKATTYIRENNLNIENLNIHIDCKDKSGVFEKAVKVLEVLIALITLVILIKDSFEKDEHKTEPTQNITINNYYLNDSKLDLSAIQAELEESAEALLNQINASYSSDLSEASEPDSTDDQSEKQDQDILK